MKNILLVVAGLVVGSLLTTVVLHSFSLAKTQPPHRAPFQTNLTKAAADNQNFRQVLFTGTNSQLVVMSIPPGGEVGQETHKDVEQILYFQSGTGQAILDGATSTIVAGDVVIVTPGTQHNFINTGKTPLKIFTTYAPPNHIEGRIQQTKAAADADTADEDFGEAQ